MKFYSWLFSLVIFLVPAVDAQNTPVNNNDEANYKQVITERADKIVAELGVANATTYAKVRTIIAAQYLNLREIHDERDAKLKTVKEKEGLDKQTKDAQVKAIEDEAAKKQDKLHASFLKVLSRVLSEEQIDKVKDGMTYSALPKTYTNYLAMLPNLKEAEKKQIWNWLSEAREHAMDGGSSKEKLGWFGKYKGKITNYLTAAGYDLKKEEEVWLNSIKDEAAAKKIVASLTLIDSAKSVTVSNVIVQHYKALRAFHIERSADIKLATQQQGVSKQAADSNVAKIWEDAKPKLLSLHQKFILDLGAQLTIEQVNKLKDEMTEGGLQKEYDKFIALLPALTEVQKQRVMEYLVEARENAMDVLLAKEQHQWFGKYRGRANNYLAKEGYNLRKATEELEAKKAVATQNK